MEYPVKLKDRVEVTGLSIRGIGPRGTVVNIRSDSDGILITVVLDDVTVTPDGVYTARLWEIETI